MKRMNGIVSSKLNHEIQKEEKSSTFEFLIPEIPPLKSERNIIPTGRQIPRTPLKHEILVSEPPVNSSEEAESCIGENDEILFKNMIPKGREIPRTPPYYRSIPFLLSGCQMKPSEFELQPIDLGVKPLEEVDDLDNVIINEDNITVRKRQLPKAYNLDLVLSDMVEVVNCKNDLTIDENEEKITKSCISSGSHSAHQNNEPMKEEKQQCTLLNAEIAESNEEKIIKHLEGMEISESCMKDGTKLEGEKKKRGKTRTVPKKTSILSAVEGEVDIKKPQRCRNKSKTEVCQKSLKENIEPLGHINVNGSTLKDLTKKEEETKIGKKKGRTKTLSKTLSLSSKESKEYNETGIKLEEDRNKENLIVSKQEFEKSVESSVRGRRKCNGRANVSLPLDSQTRRNPRRRAKEGVDYRLS